MAWVKLVAASHVRKIRCEAMWNQKRGQVIGAATIAGYGRLPVVSAASNDPLSKAGRRIGRAGDDGSSDVRDVYYGLLIAAIQISASHIATASADDYPGLASVYSSASGSGTASGQRLDTEALTAAHRTLPFGTKVRVTNKANGRSVVVTINDRGPFARGRIIDVTPAAAQALGFSGLTQVTLSRE